MSFEVRLEPPAAKKLGALDRVTRERILRRLREMAVDPFDPRVGKPLKGARKLRSSRVGDWRALYVVRVEEHAVHVLSINPRGRAYRDL